MPKLIFLNALKRSVFQKSVLNVVRKLENVKTKIIKLQEDIKFIKTCKRENLIPTFANVN